MAGMSLDNYRAADRKGGGGVAAGNRERERKVRSGEDGDRANRPEKSPHVWTGRCGVGHGVVDYRL